MGFVGGSGIEVVGEACLHGAPLFVAIGDVVVVEQSIPILVVFRFEVVCVCDYVMLVCLFVFDLILHLAEIISCWKKIEN